MKLVLFGTGMIGSCLLTEALRRGHSVTVATTVKGHDAVLSAVGGTPDVVRHAPSSLLDEVERPRYIRQRFTLGY